MKAGLGLAMAISLGGWIAQGQAARAHNRTMLGPVFGIITLGAHYERQDTIRIYNDDGSEWYKFTYYYDDSDGKWDYPNDDFAPLEFDVDEFGLGLEVVGEQRDGYTVIVDHETGLRKHIRKAAFLKFVTWEQYIIHRLVDFDPSKNPLRQAPRLGADTIPYPTEAALMESVKVQGAWLQIKWTGPAGPASGWVRWHDGPKLLIWFTKD